MKRTRSKKDAAMRIRISSEAKAALQKAAAKAGLSLSSWVVTTCLKAVT
jgi:uncharacterized protein (DUF1778 family)